ncbi:NAD(P)/FAD-dependent oxidoreductase [Agrococcus sp. ARC_14]|uniref:FAD-dependent oxidoreductase n=1 Tax=Agrococcus sp. ARC_14 TaxID=2919927 RepID=UPI001F06F3A3|nr:NAD(P)/FAD-dependent oxidoreductase [Agrococcus sp. ARC_14]MCH1884163.1 FAD-dependent monooxygenase [Agrococcus sp. ARC_14]
MTWRPGSARPGIEQHDVAIVGAGAVGLLLACLLSQRGIDVVVLERRSEPGSASRAFGIHPPGLAALDAAGVGETVRAEALEIRSGAALSGGRRIATLDLSERPVHALPQHRTEMILRERLAALAPAALRTGAEVIGLWQDADGVELTLTGGGCVGARWAVGADGVRSRVRQLLGIELRQRRGVAGYAMADVDDADAGAAALLHLEPGGIVESFPLPAGRRRWVVRLAQPQASVTAEQLQRILDERLRGPSGSMRSAAVPSAELPHAAPPGGTVPSGTVPSGTVPSAFLARQRLAARFASGRVALAGDAAHELSPIGGQGMSLGWLDALALERAIAGAQPGAAPFATYARVRRAAAARAMRRAAWNMAMGAPASESVLAGRLALVRALALPPARAALVAAFTMRGL